MQDYETRIERFIRAELIDPAEEINLLEEENLLVTGVIDSLGVIRLVEFIEDELAIVVPPQDITLQNFRNLTAMRDYLLRRKEMSK